ncbi:MAG TPA: type II toxin-antitoxin system PemK/MazF family toxin [Methanoregulaceae archaeon]|nr:type II toxin-antitoxin system PemK/MazF family toxin [Methanoregulaceae archaeon]
MKIGEIWLVDLEDSKGHEQQGTRPIVVGLAHSMIIIVPLTTSLSSARFSYTQLISPTHQNGLANESIVLVFQIATLDQVRLRHRIGSINEGDRQAINSLLIEEICRCISVNYCTDGDADQNIG